MKKEFNKKKITFFCVWYLICAAFFAVCTALLLSSVSENIGSFNITTFMLTMGAAVPLFTVVYSAVFGAVTQKSRYAPLGVSVCLTIMIVVCFLNNALSFLTYWKLFLVYLLFIILLSFAISWAASFVREKIGEMMSKNVSDGQAPDDTEVSAHTVGTENGSSETIASEETEKEADSGSSSAL